MSELLFDDADITCVGFNQDGTCIAVGTKTGYYLYAINSLDRAELVYSQPNEHVVLVERLLSTRLVALVNQLQVRKMRVCYLQHGTEIVNYSYANSILAIKMNRQRLVVCLEESIFIHNMTDMKILHTIRDTPPNKAGLIALSCGSAVDAASLLAYPGSSQTGEVQVFDTISLRAVASVPAHNSPLAAIAFNSEATRLATASEKGTVIRVFSIPEGQKVFEFRRGVKRNVNITCLTFVLNSSFLCASSDMETIHVFKMDETKDSVTSSNNHQQSWTEYFGSVLKQSANYLPSHVGDVLHQDRAYLTAKLQQTAAKTFCTVNIIDGYPRLVVLTQTGHLYFFNFDLHDMAADGSGSPMGGAAGQAGAGGGECAFVKMIRLNRDYTRRLSSANQTTSTGVGVGIGGGDPTNIGATGLNLLSSSPQSSSSLAAAAGGGRAFQTYASAVVVSPHQGTPSQRGGAPSESSSESYRPAME